MKTLALIAATLLAACDATYVTPPGGVTGDPCLYRTYHDPMCDTGFTWSPGYYNPSHVWIAPRYIRRTTVVVPHYVAPAPVIVTRPTYVAPAPSYRVPVTTTTTIRRSSAFAPRPTTTVTTTRRYR